MGLPAVLNIEIFRRKDNVGMPFYDVMLIMKPFLKPDLAASLKRCCTKLINNGAVITSLSSLGYRDLPYKMKKEQSWFITGSYVLVQCCMPVRDYIRMADEFHRDSDIIHSYFHQVDPNAEPLPECTLAEELQPPAYRKSVQNLRKHQKLGLFAKIQAKKRAVDLVRAVPKSLPIAPHRR
ncbi:hypothetical protein M513_01391 [Trichuris suis]|uniref:Small ribosomal subunit protein bS6m n=1 Tax=Trichuris suis TaxID=68888 RepID=A0A085MKH5_9BILA|nr:hypothetical protein M513_01391 [Trichuris suis]